VQLFLQNILQPALAAAAQPGRPGDHDLLWQMQCYAIKCYLVRQEAQNCWTIADDMLPSQCTVSFKNFEAATYQSYAQASALVANRESVCFKCILSTSKLWHLHPAYLPAQYTMMPSDGSKHCTCRTVCVAANAPGWSGACVLGSGHQLLRPELPGKQPASECGRKALSISDTSLSISTENYSIYGLIVF
jgi:hypothetical protein